MRFSSALFFTFVLLAFGHPCFGDSVEPTGETTVPAPENTPENAAEPPIETEPVVTPAEPADLADDFQTVLKMLRTESPALYQKLNEAPRQEQLLRILQALDAGVSVLNEENTGGEFNEIIRADSSEKDCFPAKMIDNRVLYARLDKFDAAAVKQLREDLTDAARLASPPDGLILDLRNATDNDFDLVSAATSFFIPGRMTFIPHYQRIPLMILTGPNTSGAPERFAAFLSPTKHVMIIGEPGRGRMFPLKRAEAASMVWLVPELEIGAERLPSILIPSISIPAMPQCPYAQIGRASPEFSRDAPLNQALNLIAAIRASSGVSVPGTPGTSPK